MIFTSGKTLPVTVKMPLVVVLMTIAVSAVISERVLSRLGQLQREHVGSLATAYLDGLSSSLLPAMLRDDVWEAFDALDRARQLYASLRPIETVVTKPGGEVVAATDPDRTPVLSQFPTVQGAPFNNAGLAFNGDGTLAFLRRDLVYQDRSIGIIYSSLDISHLVAERRSVLRTLIGTNSVLAVIFAALGYFAVNRMVQPIRVLSDHLEEGLHGVARPIADNEFPRGSSPFNRLFLSYNALVAAEKERELLSIRLAGEEKVASLGRLASGMAHEINNPLGGLFNAIDTLKAHGEKPVVRASSLALIERGLIGIRDVVRAALTTYRPVETWRAISARDFDDLRVLLGPETRRRRQVVEWQITAEGLLPIPGTPIRQAALNLLLNASAASGDEGRIRFSATTADKSKLSIEVEDSGPGMSPEATAVLTGERGYAMLGDGKGLGLWMVRRLVEEVGGTIEVAHSALGGALVRLQYDGAARTKLNADVA